VSLSMNGALTVRKLHARATITSDWYVMWQSLSCTAETTGATVELMPHLGERARNRDVLRRAEYCLCRGASDTPTCICGGRCSDNCHPANLLCRELREVRANVCHSNPALEAIAQRNRDRVPQPQPQLEDESGEKEPTDKATGEQEPTDEATDQADAPCHAPVRVTIKQSGATILSRLLPKDIFPNAMEPRIIRPRLETTEPRRNRPRLGLRQEMRELTAVVETLRAEVLHLRADKEDTIATLSALLRRLDR